MSWMRVFVVLWCNVRAMMRGRVKGKPGAGISLFLSKSTKDATRLTSSSNGRIAINSTYAITCNAEEFWI